MSLRAVALSIICCLRLCSSADPIYNFTTCACTNATLGNTTFVSIATQGVAGLNLDEVKMYNSAGNQLLLTVQSWSQCFSGNCGTYGPQYTVDGQIWNSGYLSSGINQMVLTRAFPAFVTYKVQGIVAKLVIFDRKLNTPAWYTNLGSYVVFHNSSTSGLASSFWPGNVTQNISWQLDMCPDSGGIVSPAACPCFSGTFSFQCPSTCLFSPSSNAALWSIVCSAGSYKASTCASSCTLCPSGTFTSTAGSTSCQQCPGGHYCPAGTASWASLNCGRGNYCPDGSDAPKPCPYQVPPSGGWGALQVQGPAFLVETASCLNHCFWNFTSGDGMLSKC